MSATQVNNERFDANVFRNATTEEEKKKQIENWMTGNGSSVFVQWIPDELSDAGAHNYFSQYGKIDRVEFVPKFNEDRSKQIGRMLFVHFSSFYNPHFALDIATAHPEPALYSLQVSNRFGAVKEYSLKCRINTRPITKVEYNASQLTDMFENLNQRVTNELVSLREENMRLREEMDTIKQLLLNHFHQQNDVEREIYRKP